MSKISDIPGIYNQLYIGNSIQLSFDSTQELLSFKSSLSRHKAAQEKQLLLCELMTHEEQMIISFLKESELTFTIKLKKKPPVKQYIFTIIEAVDQENELS